MAKAIKRAADLETELKLQRTRASAAAEWAEREKQRLVAATAAAAAMTAPAAAEEPAAPVAAPSDLVADLRLSAEAAWQRADALADELQSTADELQAVQAELLAERSARCGGQGYLAVAQDIEVTPPASPVRANVSMAASAELPEAPVAASAASGGAGVPVVVTALAAVVAGALGALLGAAMRAPEPKVAPKQQRGKKAANKR